MADIAHGGTQEKFEERVKEGQEGAGVMPSIGNFVAVPVPISNPTLGTGLQVVLLYLHPQRNDSQSINATSGLLGLYTNSESWVAGIFHDDYWAGDTYHFTGVLGGGNLNLKFYGIGDSPLFDNNPLDYELTAIAYMFQLQRRIPWIENLYAGVHYTYIDSDITFKTSNLLPGLPLPDLRSEIRTAGLGLIATYDSRDDNYYAQKGQLIQLKWTNYQELWGGDFEYDKLAFFFNHYQPVLDQAVLALRCNFQGSRGDPPFFDLPYLDLRGVSQSRYQDNFTFSLHAEGRYKFLPRWGGVAFIETGWLGDDLGNLFSGRNIVSYGGGVRWQVTKAKKLNLGLDYAISTDDQALFIQIGEKF